MKHRITETKGNRELSLAKLLDRLEDRDIIYIGEFHQLPEVLSFQMDIVSGLLEKNYRPSLCLEIFNVLQQEILDYYISGAIPFGQLLELYEKSPEGFDLDQYSGLIEAARKNKLRIIGLNIPRNIASEVAKNGLDRDTLRGFHLSEESIRNCPEKYAAKLKDIYRKHPHADMKEENFILAQSIKDEMMAETIVHYFKNKTSGRPFIVIAGRGHVEYGIGIPERVKKKLNEQVSDAIIAVAYEDEKPCSGLADYILRI